ncbi:MAG: hypothetical protein O2969_10265, partial [Actinomycetota bacterium]|nr:hypothetical protein [Actinomycetota bacterium]
AIGVCPSPTATADAHHRDIGGGHAPMIAYLPRSSMLQLGSAAGPRATTRNNYRPVTRHCWHDPRRQPPPWP